MSARGYPKRSARAAGINTYSTSRRPRRSAGNTSSGGGGDRLVVSTENLGVPAVPWTKVLRYPSAPLDEPYFGRSPKASFQIPMWVRVDELTEEEKAKYDEEKKKKEEQRALWKKQMEKSKDQPSQEVVEGQSKDDVQKSSNIEEGGDKSQPSTVAEGKTDTSTMQVDPPSSDPQTVKESQDQQDQIIIMNEDTQRAIADGPNGDEEKVQPPVESAAATATLEDSSAAANNGQQSSTEEGQQGEGSGQSQQ